METQTHVTTPVLLTTEFISERKVQYYHDPVLNRILVHLDNSALVIKSYARMSDARRGAKRFIRRALGQD